MPTINITAEATNSVSDMASVNSDPQRAGMDTTENWRSWMRFSLATLPVGASVTQVDLRVNVSAVDAAAADNTVSVGLYGANGQDDPAGDTDPEQYANMEQIEPDLVVASTLLQTVGEHTFTDMGASAEFFVAAANAGPDRISLVIRSDSEAEAEAVFAWDPLSGGSPPRLTITYTDAPAGGEGQRTMMRMGSK